MTKRCLPLWFGAAAMSLVVSGCGEESKDANPPTSAPTLAVRGSPVFAGTASPPLAVDTFPSLAQVEGVLGWPLLESESTDRGFVLDSFTTAFLTDSGGNRVGAQTLYYTSGSLDEVVVFIQAPQSRRLPEPVEPARYETP
jgi:hypothetical protein